MYTLHLIEHYQLSGLWWLVYAGLIVCAYQRAFYNVLVLRQCAVRALYPTANRRVKTNKPLYHDASRNMSSSFKRRAN